MPQWGCDWTWRQGEIPASRIEEEGYGYTWLKAGGAINEGWTFIDKWFLPNAELVLNTEVVPGAYWYLMPGGTGWQQAALCHALIHQTTEPNRFMVKLDVEQPGLTREDVFGWLAMWRRLESNWPVWCYTRKNFWTASNLGMNQGMLLEEAHWVPDVFANDPALPYASQQWRHFDPSWMQVDYAGWDKAPMVQFSGHGLVGSRTVAGKVTGGRWVPVSRFIGGKADLQRMSLKP